MSRRLLDLRGGPGQRVSVYEDAGPSLYLGVSTSPAHIVVSLTAGQVEHLIGTLTDWLDGQQRRRPFSPEQSPAPSGVGQEGLVGRPPV